MMASKLGLLVCILLCLSPIKNGFGGGCKCSIDGDCKLCFPCTPIHPESDNLTLTLTPRPRPEVASTKSVVVVEPAKPTAKVLHNEAVSWSNGTTTTPKSDFRLKKLGSWFDSVYIGFMIINGFANTHMGLLLVVCIVHLSAIRSRLKKLGGMEVVCTPLGGVEELPGIRRV